jgi:hypothetical protein
MHSVKVSAIPEGRYAEIHGDRQLEPLPGGNLYMIYLRMEGRPEGGQTVPGTIDRVVNRGVPRLALLELLERVGYSALDKSTYDRMRYDVLEQLTYAVDDSFPRVIPASFIGGITPIGVSHLRYIVDLSGPAPAPLDATAAAGVLDRFSGRS